MTKGRRRRPLTMRLVAIVGSIAFAMSLTAAALATGGTGSRAAAKDPTRMILHTGDFPGWTFEPGDSLDSYLKKPLQAAGLSGRVATYIGGHFSQAKGSQQVSGIVLTVDRAADARKVFAITKKARDQTLRRATNPWTPITLPRHGDEQRVLVEPPGAEGIAIAEMIVRKNTTVWLLYVSLERRPKPPVSELVTDLKRFAAKKRARVGVG